MKNWILLIVAICCLGAIAKFQYFDKQDAVVEQLDAKKPAVRERHASPAHAADEPVAQSSSQPKPQVRARSKDVAKSKPAQTPENLDDAGIAPDMVLLPEPKAKKVVLPTSFADGSISPDQAMDAAYAAKLQSFLLKQFDAAGDAMAIAKKLQASPELQLRLMQWQLLTNAVESEKGLSKYRSDQEALLAKSLKEIEEMKGQDAKADAMAAKIKQVEVIKAQIALPISWKELFEDKTAATVFQAVNADADFLSDVFYSGEAPAVVRMMTIFSRLVAQDSDLLKAGRRRDIAQAIAMEYARFNWDADVAVKRGQFFLRYFDEGRFHRVSKQVSMPLVRLWVGAKGNHNSMSVSSMQWYVDNAHMPQKYYTGFKGQGAICWRCGWRRNNLIGDSIHRNYYETYTKGYGDNFARQTLDLGGVCGAISSFGAGCALGNGIPAMTMGEPGHCAYTILVDGKWMPAYSLSWKRNLHWQHWDGVNFFSSLQMAHDMYNTKSQAAKTTQALQLCAAATCLEKNKDAGKVSDLYQVAIKLQPNSYPIYRDYLAFLDAHPQGNTAAVVLKDMCQSLTKEYPEMAAFILQKNGMPVLDKANANVRTVIATDFWRACEGESIAPWDMTAYLSAQADWIGKAEGKPNVNIVKFYGKLLAAVIKKEELTPAVMSWASTWSQKQDKRTQEEMSKTTMSVLKAAASKGISMDVMLAKAILNAEATDDIDSFITLNKMVDEDKRYEGKMPEFEPFPGELISAGGLVRMSSTIDKHDTPLKHAGLLDLRGGKFHTGKDKDAYVVVQMPRIAQVSGLVFIGTPNQRGRLKNIKVQVSETGADGSWEDVHDCGDATPDRVNRIDLSQKKPRARFVRLLRVGGPEFFHLNGIYIYGKRSS
ncbi:MAG: hypothetical protein R3Y56_06960 [Akkermansia sp.]